MADVEELLLAMGVARQRNIGVFTHLSRLTDAELLFTPRKAGEPDVTMEVIRRAVLQQPNEAQRLLAEVANNDLEVTRLTVALIAALGKSFAGVR